MSEIVGFGVKVFGLKYFNEIGWYDWEFYKNGQGNCYEGVIELCSNYGRDVN